MIAVQTAEAPTADQIKPLWGRALIRRLKRPELTKGGVALAETSRDVSQIGQILACGPEVTEVRVGELVIFSIYAAAPCIATQAVEDDLVFVREQDIFAIYQGAADSGKGDE